MAQEKSKREILKEEKIKVENIRKLDERIKENKKIPKEYKKKINKKIIITLFVAIAMAVYLTCLNIMFLYIDTNIYLSILKVLSIVVAIISIVYFEVAYKKDNEGIFLYAVEVLFLGLITLFMNYAYYLFFDRYNLVVGIITIVIFIYYVIKMLIIKRNMKKQYYKSQNDIKEIVKKG